MTKSKNTKNLLPVTVAAVILAVLTACFAVYRSVIGPHLTRTRILSHKYEVYGGIKDEFKESGLFKDMQSGKSFFFLGDSITAGTVTEGLPWYNPLTPHIKGSISNLSSPGWTVNDLLYNQDKIRSADIYVIAIGVNDALKIGNYSKTSDEYINGCRKLSDIIKKINPDAVIYFIAPWNYVNLDNELMQRGNELRKALSEWCSKTGYRFIDPVPVIAETFAKEGSARFMYNEFHPNAPEGIELFSYAVLKSACGQTADVP